MYLETVEPLSWRKVRVIFLRYFDVRRIRRSVDKIKRETAALYRMIAEVTEANKQLEKDLEQARSERDELLIELSKYQIVDPNGKCPGCGATDGVIETKQDFENQVAYVEHSCKVCKCIWPEAPVHKDLAKMYAKPMPPGPGKPAGVA